MARRLDSESEKMANFLRLERRIISTERLRATSSAVKMLAWLLMRKLFETGKTQRRKRKIEVQPGKSVTGADFPDEENESEESVQEAGSDEEASVSESTSNDESDAGTGSPDDNNNTVALHFVNS